MGQITLYLPAKIEELVKKEAKLKRKSVSAFVSELLEQRVSPRKWSREFLKICGNCHGDFPEIENLPEEKRDELL